MDPGVVILAPNSAEGRNRRPGDGILAQGASLVVVLPPCAPACYKTLASTWTLHKKILPYVY